MRPFPSLSPCHSQGIHTYRSALPFSLSRVGSIKSFAIPFSGANATLRAVNRLREVSLSAVISLPRLFTIPASDISIGGKCADNDEDDHEDDEDDEEDEDEEA